MVTGSQRLLEQTYMRKNNLKIPPLVPVAQRNTGQSSIIVDNKSQQNANNTKKTQHMDKAGLMLQLAMYLHLLPF